MLTLIGIGLFDEKDITLRGLEAVRQAKEIYLEGYTSILSIHKEELEKLYTKTVTVLSRTDVESKIEPILQRAKTTDICILIIGDVFGATTHSDIYLRAKQLSVPVRVIHNASILNAIGSTGIDLYRFGRTTTIVLPQTSYAPESFYEVITENQQRGLHTLCLLDIKTDVQQFMTIPQAIQRLEEIEEKRHQKLPEKIVGCARIAHPDQKVVYAERELLKTIEWGAPLHSIIIPAHLHEIEEQMLLSHNH